MSLNHIRQGLLSLIYEVQHQIPFGYQLTQTTNERVAFSDLLMKIDNSSFRDKDLFIFDRGYFSSNMVEQIFSLNKDFLFRLPKNLNMIKTLEASELTDQLITHNQKVRIIKYQIPSKLKIVSNDKGSKPFKMIRQMNNYYLATTLTNQTTYPIQILKEFYHKRWSVEECYKKIKGKMNAGTFHSVLPNGIECEMAAQQLSLIITRLFIGMIRNSNKHQINSQICSNTIVQFG